MVVLARIDPYHRCINLTPLLYTKRPIWNKYMDRIKAYEHSSAKYTNSLPNGQNCQYRPDHKKIYPDICFRGLGDDKPLP